MGSWTALVASALIGALVLLSVIRFNEDVTEDMYLDMMEHVAHEQLMETVRVLEYDFSRIGLGINDPTEPVITRADSVSFTFHLDYDGNGIIDSVRYYLGDLNSAANTENPRDRVLFRVENGGPPTPVSSGLTEFHLEYFDAQGNPAASLDQITTIVLDIACESTVIYDGRFARQAWQGRFSPQTLVAK